MAVSRLLGALLVVLLCAMLVGQFVGTPVVLSYVETDSMEPTLEPGDGFVAIPAGLSGPPEEGTVVTFEAERLHGGALTTHRVVGETEGGYVTQGDANPFTDQDGQEPPIAEGQIKATALQLGGDVVVIPHLGTVAMGIQSGLDTIQRTVAAALGTRALLGAQGLGYLLGGLAIGVYLLDMLFAGSGKDRSRSRSRDDGIDPRLIAVGFALLVMGAATAAMVAPGGTQQIEMISAEFDSERPTVVPQGETSTVDYEVYNAGVLPVMAYVEPGSDRVEPEPSELYLDSRSSAELSLSLHAPDETGYYPQYVTERRYLVVLPRGVIATLYDLHPWMPLIAINGVLGGSFYLLTTIALGSGRLRDRSRNRERPAWRPRRWLYGSGPERTGSRGEQR